MSPTTNPMKIMDCRVKENEGRSTENWVLATREAKLYIAMKKGNIDLKTLKQIDASTWSTWKDKIRCQPPVRLLPENLWPRARSSYQRFELEKGEAPSAVFTKKRDPLDIAVFFRNGMQRITQDDLYSRITEREIGICEYIRRKDSHPNVAKYRGVVCKSELKCGSPSGEMVAVFDTERVVKIVFKRYTANLQDWVMRGKPVDIEYCLTSIADGIKHLHSIGLVHCDIKPDNIFVDDTGKRHEYVVGDFDSAAEIGTLCQLKGGDPEWSRPKKMRLDRVEEEDDWYAFESTKIWLVEKLGRLVSDYAHIGKSRARR